MTEMTAGFDTNGYLEAMLGGYRARVAPVNVNHRYVGAQSVPESTAASRRGPRPRGCAALAHPHPGRLYPATSSVGVEDDRKVCGAAK